MNISIAKQVQFCSTLHDELVYYRVISIYAMIILVVNSGSSSVKFQLFEMPGEKFLMHGKAVQNTHGQADFYFETPVRKVTFTIEKYSFNVIFQALFDELVRPESECLTSMNEVDVVGHRLIHGGEQGTGCQEITKELIMFMESSVSLVPLHYPANLAGIKTIQQLLPRVLQAGVFDTAFHQTLPPRAFLYGISPDWYQKHKIRRYGFHGTSHKYASQKVCKLAGLTVETSRIVCCHLGNGASVTAVQQGQSIDTSMGFTPVEGLMMGSRCGDIDAGILIHLMEKHKLSGGEVQYLINKEGGLLGLSGISSDYRLVADAADSGNTRAQTALDVYHYRVKKYIGAYAAALEGLDALVFTGGVGENSCRAREEICRGLQFLGIELDTDKNRCSEAGDSVISKTGSRVTIAVVAANEELEIARQVTRMVESGWRT